MKNKTLFLILVILFGISASHQLSAQSKKQPLSLEDMRTWRQHSVTLSDDGAWYTTHYGVRDKASSVQDSVAAQSIEAYFGEENQTDVLYVHHVKDGLKYSIENGIKPVFSSASDWIAYQIQPDSEEEGDEKTFIELKHLATGFTVKYESSARYRFLEDKGYFITSDDNSLLVYDLENRREHYIGNIGEYLVDKKSEFIAYTIDSEDKRGNGVYLYDPSQMTTRALHTGSFLFSNLSWNEGKDALAYYTYRKVDDEVDYANINIVVTSGIKTGNLETVEYSAQDINGFAENMGFAVKAGRASNPIIWSQDGDRLFLKVKEYDKEEEVAAKSDDGIEGASVQVWHWKDEKLLSERITEYDRKKNQVYDAVFTQSSNTLIQLTDEAIQKIDYSKGTDQWAIGMDNRKYISDWDVEKNDLYRINLVTGEKTLIQEKHSQSYWNPNYQIAPDGKKVVFWNGAHYWVYDFAADEKQNISEGVGTSFVNVEYDQFGYVPDYGFTGWVKDRNAVMVSTKHDLWLLPLDQESQAQNLTASVTANDSIGFSIEDSRFTDEPAIEDRYIDLSEPLLLAAYNTQTKYAGFYRLEEGKLTQLIYEPASFFHRPWRGYRFLKSKHSDAIIYVKGDYQNYPEAYLSTTDFTKPKRITFTNPQQEKFRWGNRILIEYTNDDGVPLQGVLSIPEGYKKGQKLPMIVHSYETFSWRMYQHAAPYLSGASVPEMLYVSDGYLFLQPDIHFNIGTPHSDMHECIDAAIRKVIELGYVDEERIGYEGFSFGGHCGMFISTQDNKFAAIAAGAGVSNLVQGFNIDIVWDGSNEQDYYMTSQGRLATDPTSDTEMYIRESPVFNAQTMDTPLLLFHGTNDKVVQWEHSFGFYSILRYLKKPVVFLSYRGEGHGLDDENNRLDIQTRLKDFFDHYLKGAEAQRWMLEEIPYIPIDESDEEEREKRTLPKWK